MTEGSDEFEPEPVEMISIQAKQMDTAEQPSDGQGKDPKIVHCSPKPDDVTDTLLSQSTEGYQTKAKGKTPRAPPDSQPSLKSGAKKGDGYVKFAFTFLHRWLIEQRILLYNGVLLTTYEEKVFYSIMELILYSAIINKSSMALCNSLKTNANIKT